ncbi:MAG: aldo/keto reductase [Candidatus Latescibacteria bacterium]|nr:aldo/keto reductase [Candidatus Latescibacterota bacterium]
MEYRTLGKTGIRVSEIGLGCWAIGGASFRGGQPTGWAGADIVQSLETVRRAWELGVTLYDTADAYGRGKSEVLVGLGLLGHKPEAILATKVGNSLAQPGQYFSPDYIQGALDASLTRLEVDRIDLYQLHGPPLDAMTDELFGLMNGLKASGKVRAWGVSIGSVAEGMRAIEGGAEALQLVYNILQPEAGDALFPVAQAKGVGILVRVPLASGWLTGKYNARTVFPPDDHRSQRYTPARVAETAAKVAQLDFLLEEADTLAEAALRFTLAHPAVSTVIPGAKTPGQVIENVKASGRPLSAEALRRIRALFGKS